MRKKIFRVTEEDENDLRMLVQFVQDFYITERARRSDLSATTIPNESSIIRALIRVMYPVAAGSVAAQRAELRGEEGTKMPEVDIRAVMLRLFEDGHLGDDRS